MFGKRSAECEEVVRINLESVNVQVEKSILLVDKETSNILSSLYKFESFTEKFAPLLFQTLPLPLEPPVTLSATSKVVFMISSYLWDSWEVIRRTVRQLQFPQLSPNAPHPTLTVTVFCGVSDDSHQNMRPDFAPNNTSAYKFVKV